jgi:flagellar protein FlaG
MTVGAMSLEIGRFTPNLHASVMAQAPLPGRTAAVTEAPATVEARPLPGTDIPPTPPEQVKAQVEAAARRAAEFAANNRELHFARDEETGRIIIQVRQLDGRVVRTIPPSHALALMTGPIGSL